MQNFAESQLKKCIPKSKIHVVERDDYKEYYDDVARTADVMKMLDVIADLFFEATKIELDEPFEYRKYKYTIIDDKTFVKEKEI